MGTTPSAWAVKMLEVLDDGAWHPLNELLDAAIPYVPPGIAARCAERGRTQQGGPARRVKGDQQTAIDAGARTKVHEAINVRVHGHTLERRRRGGITEIRKPLQRRAGSDLTKGGR